MKKQPRYWPTHSCRARAQDTNLLFNVECRVQNLFKMLLKPWSQSLKSNSKSTAHRSAAAHQVSVQQRTEVLNRRLQEHHYVPVQRFPVLPQISVFFRKHRHFWENMPSCGYTRVQGSSQSPLASLSLMQFDTFQICVDSKYCHYNSCKSHIYISIN